MVGSEVGTRKVKRVVSARKRPRRHAKRMRLVGGKEMERYCACVFQVKKCYVSGVRRKRREKSISAR